MRFRFSSITTYLKKFLENNIVVVHKLFRSVRTYLKIQYKFKKPIWNTDMIKQWLMFWIIK